MLRNSRIKPFGRGTSVRCLQLRKKQSIPSSTVIPGSRPTLNTAASKGTTVLCKILVMSSNRVISIRLLPSPSFVYGLDLALSALNQLVTELLIPTLMQKIFFISSVKRWHETGNNIACRISSNSQLKIFQKAAPSRTFVTPHNQRNNKAKRFFHIYSHFRPGSLIWHHHE